MKKKVYDSMKQAAAAEAIPYRWLQAAKDAGSEGFEASRVNIGPVKKWIADHGADLVNPDSGSIEDKIKSETWRKLKIRNDRDEGKVVSKAEVAASIRRALGGVAALSESKLVNEWPTAVAGLDPAQARIYGRRLHDSLMAECQKLSKEYPE